jgi:hypothetical protein
MFHNADNISPVGMRWIYLFLHFCSVTVAECSGDMNENLKSKAVL